MKTTNLIRFSLEVHREEGGGPLKIVDISVDRGAVETELIVEDISEAFNPHDHAVRDFAYRISFTLPTDLIGDESVFADLAKYGLVKTELVEACRAAIRGTAND